MRLMRKFTVFSLFALAGILLAGCAMTNTPLGNAEMPYPPERPPRVGDILHLPTGVYVTEAQMLDAATDTRIVYVGESHDNPASHRLQLQVLAAMAERYPGKVSLGMEMFNTEQQPVLDRWTNQEIDEKTFLKESAWFENWRMDFDYYRDLLLFAREHRIPVIGLNASKETVETVGKTPFDQLPAELQENLPQMDMNDPYQTALTEAVFADHAAGKSLMEGFQRVQTLWDEVMAENVVKTLRAKDDDQRMVVLAGGNHIRNGFGIPRRVFRRLPLSYTLIGGHELEVAENKQVTTMNIDTPRFPMPAYDYVAYTVYESLPDTKVKLGVRMKETDSQIVVFGVIPESAAAIAGVEVDDVLLKIDDVPIEEMFDLVYEVNRKKAGDQSVLKVLRNGETLSLPVVFIPLPEMPHHPK